MVIPKADFRAICGQKCCRKSNSMPERLVNTPYLELLTSPVKDYVNRWIDLVDTTNVYYI